MTTTFLGLAILVGGGFLTVLPVQASSFTISDSGCCSIDMNSIPVSSPITVAEFDPAPPSWILGPSPSFYAVDFSFTVNDYLCGGCTVPSVAIIEFDGNEAPGTMLPPGLQVITGSTCEISITDNGTYNTGICLVNSTDVTNISNAFNLGGADNLSVDPLEMPGLSNGQTPNATFCVVGASCTATVTFYQTAADVAPEPATVAMEIVGLALCFGMRRRWAARH
jgi:hypothetical protein